MSGKFANNILAFSTVTFHINASNNGYAYAEYYKLNNWIGDTALSRLPPFYPGDHPRTSNCSYANFFPVLIPLFIKKRGLKRLRKKLNES